MAASAVSDKREWSATIMAVMAALFSEILLLLRAFWPLSATDGSPRHAELIFTLFLALVVVPLPLVAARSWFKPIEKRMSELGASEDDIHSVRESVNQIVSNCYWVIFAIVTILAIP